MIVYDYIVSMIGKNQPQSNRVRLARRIYDNYVAWMKGENEEAGIVPIEEFIFSERSRFALKVGTLVQPVDGFKAGFRYGVVTGYASNNATNDNVFVDDAEGHGYAWEPKFLKIADIPKEVMEIAKKQLRNHCPLKEPGCRS